MSLKSTLPILILVHLTVFTGCDDPKSHSVDPCKDVVCGHGECLVEDGGAVCACETGYHAEDLECVPDGTDSCEGVTCSGHGTCVPDGEGGAACDCETGYLADGLECVWVDILCGNGLVEPGEQCDPPDDITCDPSCQLIQIVPGPVGHPCGVAADCLGNYCIADGDGWPDGYCTQVDCDASESGWETSCGLYGGDGLCLDMDGYSLCFDRCDPAASDCRDGYECFDLGGGYGVCTPEPECGNGIVESGEECDPPGPDCTADCQGTGSAPVGDLCAAATDCLGNYCITDGDGWPDGYCTEFNCDTSDTAWETSCAPFGGDGLCLDVGGYGMCFDRCDPAASDCRGGYECLDLGDGYGVCYPIPVCGNSIVEGGEECDPPGADCTADCQGTGTAPIGEICVDAMECAGNHCFADGDGWPDGYCSEYDCDTSDPAWETSCAPFGGDGLCLDMGGYGMCFDRCDPAASDCRGGYECLDLGGGYGACYPVPVCGNGIVESGEECDPPGADCTADCQGTGTAPVGDPCTSAMDCEGNWCLSDADGYPLGYCVFAGCDLAVPDSCASHGADAICVNFGTASDPYGVCMDGCSPGPGACRTDYSCTQLSPGVRICQP